MSLSGAVVRLRMASAVGAVMRATTNGVSAEGISSKRLVMRQKGDKLRWSTTPPVNPAEGS